MKELKNKRTRPIHAHMTLEEYDRVHTQFFASTCRKMSQYIRKVLLDQPITINYRNQSFDDFVTELEKLRKELNSIANSYDQALKRLNLLQDFPEIKTWLVLNEFSRESLVKNIAEIKIKMEQINDQWLQS